MSHEITKVPSEDNGSIELQPQPPPEENPSTIIEPKPSPATIKVILKIQRSSLRRTRKKKKGKNWLKDMRGWIMIVGVQVAAATYASGLSPPGGFWPDDNDGHIAGHAILHDKSENRYTTFYYANATAFMASLVVIVLLMNENFYLKQSKLVVLNVVVVLGLIGLILAYAAGSARRVTTSIYVIVLAAGVSLFVIFTAHIIKFVVGSWITKCCPWIGKALCPKWMQMAMGEKGKHNHSKKKEDDAGAQEPTLAAHV